MRSWNITLSTLASFCVLACSVDDGEVAFRDAERALASLEDADADTRTCVQVMTACLETAGDDAAARACVDEARVCLPGGDEGDEEEDSEGRPDLPDQAQASEDRSGMPELPEQVDDAEEDDEDAEGHGRPELPEVAEARAESAACADAARGCLEEASGEGAATCAEALRECVSDGPIAALCAASEEVCALEDVPADACQRVSERC